MTIGLPLKASSLEAAGEDDLLVVVDGLRLDPGDVGPLAFGELRRRLLDDQADVFGVGVRLQDRVQGLWDLRRQRMVTKLIRCAADFVPAWHLGKSVLTSVLT